MIISASRRTDIPAFFTDWFLNRIKDGYVYYRTLYDYKKIYTLNLKKEYVTCIVFWTKNPKPLLERIDELSGYRYYFQFTLNGYEKDIEPGLPDKKEIIETFINLSKKIGKEKVIWRYDPIYLNDKYTVEWHIKKFDELANKLHKYTEKCVISFIDYYKKTVRNMKEFSLRGETNEEINLLASEFSKIAKKYNLILATCAEKYNLIKYGIVTNKCIDNELIEKLFNVETSNKKDPSQRKECGCVISADIGAPDTCLHRCKYCYATLNDFVARKNQSKIDNNSPILCGSIDKDSVYVPRKQELVKKAQKQLSLFDYE